MLWRRLCGRLCRGVKRRLVSDSGIINERELKTVEFSVGMLYYEPKGGYAQETVKHSTSWNYTGSVMLHAGVACVTRATSECVTGKLLPRKADAVFEIDLHISFAYLSRGRLL